LFDSDISFLFPRNSNLVLAGSECELKGVVWKRCGLARAVLYVRQEDCSPDGWRTESRGGTPLFTLDVELGC
jgi:hypothetical protein